MAASLASLSDVSHRIIIRQTALSEGWSQGHQQYADNTCDLIEFADALMRYPEPGHALGLRGSQRFVPCNLWKSKVRTHSSLSALLLPVRLDTAPDAF